LLSSSSRRGSTRRASSLAGKPVSKMARSLMDVLPSVAR
jgi:hypothetical protein